MTTFTTHEKGKVNEMKETKYELRREENEKCKMKKVV
jgi:hypothetical protein